MTDKNGKSLRIVLVGISWPPETFIEGLIKGLIEAGSEVTVACDEKPAASWLPHPQFHWLHAPVWRGSMAARLVRTARMRTSVPSKGSNDIRRFKSHVRRTDGWRERVQAWHLLLPFAGLRWDIIYFPWNSAAISYLPLFELGSPVILSCRGSQLNIAPLDPMRSGLKEALQETFQKAAAVHCVSEAIMHQAAKYGLEPEKARVIRPAVDPQFFYPPADKLQTDQFWVTTTGTLTWPKGHEYALQSISNLRDRGINVRFNILGDGPDRQRMLYTIRDLNLEKVVRLHGLKSQEGVRELLQKSDVFLLSSLSEGISNAVLEAMACGIPIVTTDCGGMTEAVTDGVEGFVVPVRNADAITGALKMLWEDPQLRRRMGKAGRQRVEKSFSLVQQVDQFTSLYKQTAQASH